MKSVSMYKVTLTLKNSSPWVGRFFAKPTREDVVAAIQCRIDALERKRLCDSIGQLKLDQEAVPHAPANFADTRTIKTMKVAGITIGTIQAIKEMVYVVDKPDWSYK